MPPSVDLSVSSAAKYEIPGTVRTEVLAENPTLPSIYFLNRSCIMQFVGDQRRQRFGEFVPDIGANRFDVGSLFRCSTGKPKGS